MEHPAIVVALALVPCGLILYYYLRQVRQAPEPWIRVATVCAIGGSTFFVAAQLQITLKDQVPFSTDSWAWAFLVIALSEEILKLSAVLIAGPGPRRYVRMSSGLIYGVAAGLGFAAVENIMYVQSGGASTAVLRAVTAVPCHALSSAIVGTALGGYHRIDSPWRASRSVLINLLFAICLHGLYDGLILTGGQFRVGIVPLITIEAILVHFILRRARQRDRQQDIDMLRRVPLFSTAPMSALGLLADRAIHRQIEAGHEVVREGHPGNALFIVQNGRLRVHRGEIDLAELGTGDFVGEMALLTGEPRNADVTARTEALLLRVPVQALFEAIIKIEGLSPHLIATALSRGLTEEQLPSSEHLTALAQKTLDDTTSPVIDNEYGLDLSSIPLFSNLSTVDRKQILNACDLFKRGPKSKLVTQGTIGPGLCILLSGEAKVSHNGADVATLIDGNFFGEINLLTGWLATASVSSISPTALALLQWGDLYNILARNPKLGWQLLATLSERTDQLSQTLESVTQTRPSLIFRISNKVQHALMSPSPLKDSVALELQDTFSDLREIPNSASETLARYATPVASLEEFTDDMDRGYLLSSDGRILGLNELLGESRLPLIELLGRQNADISGWHLTKSHTYDSIARCPHVLRFLARGIVRTRKV